MTQKITPRIRRKFLRVIPFGVIFYVTGMIFLFVESAATGNQNLNPESTITLTFPVFIFASIAVFMAGIFIGVIEIFFLQRKFNSYSLVRKVITKFLVYIVSILVILFLTFPIAASIESGESYFSTTIWSRTTTFFGSVTFISTIVQLGFSLLLCLIYSSVSENLGSHVLINLSFFTILFDRKNDFRTNGTSI